MFQEGVGLARSCRAGLARLGACEEERGKPRSTQRSSGASPALLRRDVARRLLRPFAEQEPLHLAPQEIACGGIERRDAVLVDQHGLVREPLVPGFLRDVLVDALAE